MFLASTKVGQKKLRKSMMITRLEANLALSWNTKTRNVCSHRLFSEQAWSRSLVITRSDDIWVALFPAISGWNTKLALFGGLASFVWLEAPTSTHTGFSTNLHRKITFPQWFITLKGMGLRLETSLWCVSTVLKRWRKSIRWKFIFLRLKFARSSKTSDDHSIGNEFDCGDRKPASHFHGKGKNDLLRG